MVSPSDPFLPPVGNRHPDVSWEAAAKSKLANLVQRRRLNWMICWATQDGGRGINEQDVRLVYNKYFNPKREIKNDTASRLQELRGESENSPYDPAWVVYIYVADDKPFNIDGKPINEKPGFRKNTTQREWRELGDIFLARRNHDGNFALVQRVTDNPAAWDDAEKIDEELIELFGIRVVQQMIEEIRSYAGIRVPILRRIEGGKNGKASP